jgi:hypothetical protein
MTPKKDIVRKPTYTMPDGTSLTAYSLGSGFTLKETAFIMWYTNPGTEAFLNAGRAAVRAGYNPSNAVTQGYLLKRKPRIAKKIDELIIPAKEQLHRAIWRIAFLCRDRMFYDVIDFFRPCKRIVKIHGKEHKIDSDEVIPLNEISKENRMCIDAVYEITICGKNELWYKLPDRNKAFEMFMKCYKIIMPVKNNEEMDWKATAEIIREGPNRLLSPDTAKPRKIR